MLRICRQIHPINPKSPPAPTSCAPPSPCARRLTSPCPFPPCCDSTAPMGAYGVSRAPFNPQKCHTSSRGGTGFCATFWKKRRIKRGGYQRWARPLAAPILRGDLDQSRSNIEDLKQTSCCHCHESNTRKNFPRHGVHLPSRNRWVGRNISSDSFQSEHLVHFRLYRWIRAELVG